MKDNKIIKALECCSDNKDYLCPICPYNKEKATQCHAKMKKDAINFIEQLKRENEILSNNADEAFQEGLNENRELFKNEVKAEVIKEFIEKLIYEVVNRPSENATGGVLYNNGRVDRQNEIIDIINELAGVDFET